MYSYGRINRVFDDRAFVMAPQSIVPSLTTEKREKKCRRLQHCDAVETKTRLIGFSGRRKSLGPVSRHLTESQLADCASANNISWFKCIEKYPNNLGPSETKAIRRVSLPFSLSAIR